MSIHHFGNDPDTGFRSDVEKENSPLSIDRPDIADINYAQREASEQINITGANVKVYIRTDNGDFDEVWDEDADPTYFAPVEMKCYFKPQPQELELKRWGLDAINKTEAVFSISDLTQHWPSRMLRPGDVLELPYNHPVPYLDPGYYRVLNASPSGNYRYSWLYYNCNIQSLDADVTVRVVDDMPQAEDGKFGNEPGSRYEGGL